MSAPSVSSDADAPTLELRQFALGSADSRPATQLSLRSDAWRIGLVGDWSALFQLLSGNREACSGSARVLGCELERAIAQGVLGFAACNAPLPGSFTVSEYLRHAARLSHGSPSRAVHDAQRALDRYGLAELAKRKLSDLVLYQRRALGIALSTLTAPAVVCLEAPLHDLDAPSADYVARLCAEAAVHGRVLLSTPVPRSPSAERSLLDGCDEVIVHRRGELVAKGAPSSVFAPGTRYLLAVKGPGIESFSRVLREAFVRLEPREQAGSFRVELPEASGANTDLLLDTALDHGLIVLELEPLFAD